MVFYSFFSILLIFGPEVKSCWDPQVFPVPDGEKRELAKNQSGMQSFLYFLKMLYNARLGFVEVFLQ